MPEYQRFRPTETGRVPAAYLVPPELGPVLDRLAAHGIVTRALERPMTGDVELFRITASAQAEREFQGHRERTLEGAWETVHREVPAGTFVVPMNQPLARLAFLLLEPRSDDGLVAWNVLDAALEGAANYPILRARTLPD
jgi:hypothetical protein